MFTIIAPIPADLATAIQPYRQKYDPQAQIIPAHIGVSPSFTFDPPVAELVDHLKDIGEMHAPVKVSLAGWDIHQEKFHYLRLPIIGGKAEIIALHEHLLTGPLSQVQRHPVDYWPHIAFGQIMDEGQLEAVRQHLKWFEPHYIFRVTHFELWQRQNSTDPWFMQHRFGLEATVASPRRRKSPSQPLRLDNLKR
jgi:hypothetical protein